MNIFLWIVQGIVALIFLFHGGLFLAMPERVKEELRKGSFSPAFGRFIGGTEILAAFGLILPGWTGILRWLTPLAAIALIPIMVGAVVSHFKRKEWSQVGFCIALVLLLALVGVLRGFIIPF